MYLVEGPKILYRMALSALKLFTQLTQEIGKLDETLQAF